MYQRRLRIFLAVNVLAVLVVLLRLAHLQGDGGEGYRAAGVRLLADVELLPTVRGQILDRAGRVLAFDEPCYDFYLDYAMLVENPPDKWRNAQLARLERQEKVPRPEARAILARRMEATWALAEQITEVSRNDLARAAEGAVARVEAIRRHVGMPIRLERQPQTVITGLTEAQAAALRGRLEEMVGASVQPSHRRRYPYGQDACHLIGFLGQVCIDEPVQNAPLESRLTDYFTGDLTGRSGAEKLCEERLRGRRGYRAVRAAGTEETPAVFGQDVHLTIDVELQRRVSEILGRNGAIVVLDVPTGEVLAAVSRPTFDLNEYRRQAGELARDQVDFPLLDRCLAVRYPPGSTIKPLVALGALTTGAITSSTTFECRGYLHTPDQFNCFHKIRHGSLSVLNAIEQSCNVFFYNAGERLGAAGIQEWLAQFGYRDQPGTGLSGECAGHVGDERRTHTAAEARFMAIGQGPVAVTPMHVANAMAAIARDGLWLSPVVVKELADRQQQRRLPLPGAHLKLVREALHMVVNSPSGTAYKTARDDETEFSGKTGTAETPPVWIDANHNGVVDEGETVIHSGDMAWFAGFAPSRNPRIAFAIVVEYSDQAGGAICGPKGRQVVRLCREMGYLP